MQVKVEISLYPLKENYIEVILEFIKNLNSYENIKVETNQLSTQIFGDYDFIMNLLTKELKVVNKDNTAVAVVKIIGFEPIQ